MARELTEQQKAALARLEAEHGAAEYMVGGANAVHVDFNRLSDDFFSARIDRAGTVVDVTAAILGEEV